MIDNKLRDNVLHNLETAEKLDEEFDTGICILGKSGGSVVMSLCGSIQELSGLTTAVMCNDKRFGRIINLAHGAFVHVLSGSFYDDSHKKGGKK